MTWMAGGDFLTGAQADECDGVAGVGGRILRLHLGFDIFADGA